MTTLDPIALEAFADRLDLPARLSPFEAFRWRAPVEGRPVLHLEDVSAIPFLSEIAGVEEYQHRSRVRATTGDLYATVTMPDPDYETYCEETLELGRPEWLPVESDHPLAVARACLEAEPFGRLISRAREANGLVLHPYMSIIDVWTLADEVARAAGVEVTVVGPPPPVTWVANDKATFSDLVSLVLGPEWIPERHLSRDPVRLGELLRDMAGRHDAVGLKRTRCASAMGNLVLESGELRRMAPAETEAIVDQFLRRTEWPGDEPVLAVAWESAVSSPSTQWWIPPASLGRPHLDGIYEQILEGDRKVFVGSRPSGLPSDVNARLAEASGRVAAALQALGYVGRCSFDHLVVGDLDDGPTLLFTECNGRWGGTSTPMRLVDRVVDGVRPPYRAQDFHHERLTGWTFADVLARVGDDLFTPRHRSGRFIFYNTGPLGGHGKLDVIALAETQAEAEQALLADLPRRLAL